VQLAEGRRVVGGALVVTAIQMVEATVVLVGKGEQMGAPAPVAVAMEAPPVLEAVQAVEAVEAVEAPPVLEAVQAVQVAVAPAAMEDVEAMEAAVLAAIAATKVAITASLI